MNGGLGPQPPDTTTTAVRAVSATVTDVDPDGSQNPAGAFVLLTHLHRDHPTQPWKVTQYQLSR